MSLELKKSNMIFSITRNNIRILEHLYNEGNPHLYTKECMRKFGFNNGDIAYMLKVFMRCGFITQNSIWPKKYEYHLTDRGRQIYEFSKQLE